MGDSREKYVTCVVVSLHVSFHTFVSLWLAVYFSDFEFFTSAQRAGIIQASNGGVI